MMNIFLLLTGLFGVTARFNEFVPLLDTEQYQIQHIVNTSLACRRHADRSAHPQQVSQRFDTNFRRHGLSDCTSRAPAPQVVGN